MSASGAWKLGYISKREGCSVQRSVAMFGPSIPLTVSNTPGVG